MAKKNFIFLAIAVLSRFTPWFSWLNSITFAEVCEYHEKPQF